MLGKSNNTKIILILLLIFILGHDCLVMMSLENIIGNIEVIRSENIDNYDNIYLLSKGYVYFDSYKYSIIIMLLFMEKLLLFILIIFQIYNKVFIFLIFSISTRFIGIWTEYISIFENIVADHPIKTINPIN